MELSEWIRGENLKCFLNEIRFSDYCGRRMIERGIGQETVISLLKEHKNVISVEEQNRMHKGLLEKRYKMVFKISSTYYLIVIITHLPESILKVVNVIKTSKNMEEKWIKKIS